MVLQFPLPHTECESPNRDRQLIKSVIITASLGEFKNEQCALVLLLNVRVRDDSLTAIMFDATVYNVSK